MSNTRLKKETLPFTILDLFCGCGGLSYGFEMAGFKTLLGCDINLPALKTFQENHKHAKIFSGDINEVNKEDITAIIGDQKIDVIVGGPPCQGMSLAGPRKYEDPRNKLFLSFVRLTEQFKPKAFILENVPGLVGLYKGSVKDAIIENFTKLGYNVTYRILTASDYGVPQHRKRVFFVGLLNSEESFIFPSPTHFDPATLLSTVSSAHITCEDALSDLPDLEDDLGSETALHTKEAANDYQVSMRNNQSELFNHVASNHSDHVRNIISLVPEGKNFKSLPDELKGTRKFNVAWTRYHSKKPSPTIDTGHRHHFHYKFNRVPTVRENARLQSFPDSFRFLGSKTDQMRQVGNAVPPLLAKALATELLKYL
jgi:DNA (cytosine-5)-methyltransferase 1